MKRVKWKNKKTGLRVGIAILTVSVLTVIYSFVDKDFKILKSFDIYYSLFNEINNYYVDDVDPEELMTNSINGMLEGLDPYTVFIPESEADDLKFMTTGEYGGIGAYIRKNGNKIAISEIIEGSPAHKAGIKPGDFILEIDGVPVANKTNAQIGELMKGSEKSEITFTLENPVTNKKFTRKLNREIITIPNVSYSGIVSQNTGYMRLSGFTSGAHLEVKDAFMKLKSQGITSLIIDLRNNPGGLLIEAIDIANLFIPKGQEIVSTRGKAKQWDNTFTTENDPVDTEIPIVVLVNKNTASASEIVAGAFQDLDRAVILGQKTFGKGLVQTTRKLSYNTQLKITTAKYYIPSGRCIQARDYSHRNANGEANVIPDSLIKVFTTKNGRKVKDGGGILPDLIVENDNISRIALNLYSRNFLFNYSNIFASKHDTIAIPKKFKISYNEYAAFVAYLKEMNFDYITETDDALSKLKTIAEKEKLFDQSKEAFTALETKLKKNLTAELETYKDEISELLSEEIISRYYFQKGRIEISLPGDIPVQKAIELLNNKTKYSKILNYNSGVYANK